MSEEELDNMTRIEEDEFELSNSDVILAKPDTVIRKTWRVTNTFNDVWPEDTKIVSVTEGLCFEAPKVQLPSPGGKMDISVKIWIPGNAPKQDYVFQYIMRFYCSKLKCFGEPMIATI